MPCDTYVSCGISSRFQLLSPSERQVPHALLTRPPLSSASIGRILFPQILVRLACVKHAASVRPEPGSNSPINLLKNRLALVIWIILIKELRFVLHKSCINNHIMWFQHLAWNHVCMISYLHCLVFKEHCFLTGFVKSLSDFCKLSVWVSFYIIPHSVPFVKNFLKYFLSLPSKHPRQAIHSKALLCCISATTMYILQQICTSVNTFIKFFSYFFP